MTTTASPVSKQTASAAQETGATGAAATAIETIETGVAGVADAATNAAANAIEDLEAAESRGFSTRFPLNSAFIFTFGALGGMLFGFDTGIISGASPLIESDFGLSVSQTGFITSSVLIGSRCLTGSAARSCSSSPRCCSCSAQACAPPPPDSR